MSRDSVGYVIDDSALFHGVYDPAKAHEYYLRNRHLKGRQAAPSKTSSSRSTSKSQQTPSGKSSGGKPNRADTKSRQAELKAQNERLQKRLDHLRDVLSELVDAAKKRSGGDPNKKSEKDKAPETQADKADRNKDKKSSKPETAAQKKEKAKKAKEAYEKEHPTSLSQDNDILQEQIADIKDKIQKALAADSNRNKAGNKQSEQSGSRNNKSDKPKG